MKGTTHKRKFDSEEKWYFVPELSCDMFFGVFIPNDYYIKENGYEISNSSNFELKENQIVHGEINYHEHSCLIIN